MQAKKLLRKSKIRQRIRKKVSGTSLKPRLSVYRSNKDIYAQIIDDNASHTLIATSSREKEIVSKKVNKTEKSKLVGVAIAKRAIEAGIKEVVFDRGGNLYHGRIKSLADGAREGGLKF